MKLKLNTSKKDNHYITGNQPGICAADKYAQSYI